MEADGAFDTSKATLLIWWAMTRSTVHRLAPLGVMVLMLTYLVLVWLISGRGNFLIEVWTLPAYARPSTYVTWAAILVLALVSFVVRQRNELVDLVLTAALTLCPAAWIALDILGTSSSLPKHEYWGYFSEMVMFRWLLAGVFAEYALTLALACAGIWAATKPRLS